MCIIELCFTFVPCKRSKEPRQLHFVNIGRLVRFLNVLHTIHLLNSLSSEETKKIPLMDRKLKF